MSSRAAATWSESSDQSHPPSLSTATEILCTFGHPSSERIRFYHRAVPQRRRLPAYTCELVGTHKGPMLLGVASAPTATAP